MSTSRSSEIAPREARFPALLGMDPNASALLDLLAVIIVGCGSVGHRVALHIARLHPRSMLLIDPSSLKLESVLTHEILPSQVGTSKVDTTARSVRAISPATRVLTFRGRVEEMDIAALASATVAILATDNLAAEVAFGQSCLHIGLNLVCAAVSGETLIAQVRFFDNQDGDSPCPSCGFGPQERRLLDAAAVFRCDGSGSRDPRRAAVIPTRSFSFLCSLAADLAVNQVLRHVLRLGQPVARTMVQYCGFTHASQVFPLLRRSSCPCDHSVWSRASSSVPLARATLRDIARTAGVAAGVCGAPLPPDLSFSVGGLRYFEEAVCCGVAQRAGSFGGCFGTVGGVVGTCSICKGPSRGDQFHALASAPSPSAPADAPLASLGAASPGHVVVHARGQGTLVL